MGLRDLSVRIRLDSVRLGLEEEGLSPLPCLSGRFSGAGCAPALAFFPASFLRGAPSCFPSSSSILTTRRRGDRSAIAYAPSLQICDMCKRLVGSDHGQEEDELVT